MNAPRKLLAGASLLISTMVGRPATGIDWIEGNTNLTFYGDLRLRYEVDWDSQAAAGVARDDRHCGRLRARVGTNYRFSDAWSAGARIRTGNAGVNSRRT
jgi:hypothetical protein